MYDVIRFTTLIGELHTYAGSIQEYNVTINIFHFPIAIFCILNLITMKNISIIIFLLSFPYSLYMDEIGHNVNISKRLKIDSIHWIFDISFLIYYFYFLNLA